MIKYYEKEHKGYSLIYGNGIVSPVDKRSLTLQGSQPVKRRFMFMRSFAEMHYKCGEISLNTYTTIIDLLDREEERMTLESEE